MEVKSFAVNTDPLISFSRDHIKMNFNKIGRPEHSEWDILQFKRVHVVINNVTKSNALCLLCNKHLANTSVSRLKSHRQVCCDKNVSDSQNFVSRKRKERSVSCSNEEENNNLSTNLSITDTDVNETLSSGGMDNTVTKNSCQELVLENQSTVQSIFTAYEKHQKHVVDTRVTTHQVQKPPTKKSLKCFIDIMSKEETDKIREKLFEFLIVLNKGLNYIESKYFQNLLGILRPSFKAPSYEELLQLVPIVYKKHMKNLSEFKCTGVLFVVKSDDGSFFSSIANTKNDFMFVDYKTNNYKEDFISSSIAVVKEKYKQEIHSIVANYELDDYELEFRVFLCFAKQLQMLIDRIKETNTYISFKKLLYECRIPLYESNIFIDNINEQDLSSFYKVTLCCYNNLKEIRKLLINNQDCFSSECTNILLNRNFENELSQLVNVFRHIHEIFSKQSFNYVIADAIEDWKIMENDPKNELFKNLILTESKHLYKAFVITANRLHPSYRGKMLKDQEIKVIMEYLLLILNENTLSNYMDYEEGEGIFRALFKKNFQSWEIFWKAVTPTHPEISLYATRLLRIQAFTQI